MWHSRTINNDNMGGNRMNYQQQLEVVQAFMVQPDQTMRLDCPFCNHKNTLSISNDDNSLSWYCFHASCTAKGTQKKKMTMSTVHKTFNAEEIKQDDKFVVPEHFKSVYSNEKAMHYLNVNNCWEAFAWRRADIKYDVKQDRVVFLIKDHDNIRGAVGKALSKETYPKWYMYGNKNIPFKCGQCEDVVLVEDCASACAVSNILTGVALMGTSYNDLYNPYIVPYRDLYIALDRDATSKAFDIANHLRYRGFSNVKVKILEDDLKYYNTEQIRNIFYGL